MVKENIIYDGEYIMYKNKYGVNSVTTYEIIQVVIGASDPKLKQDIDDWNHFNKKDKINCSAVCRKALREEVNKKRNMIRV